MPSSAGKNPNVGTIQALQIGNDEPFESCVEGGDHYEFGVMYANVGITCKRMVILICEYFINVNATYKIKIYNYRIVFFVPYPLFGKLGFLCEN